MSEIARTDDALPPSGWLARRVAVTALVSALALAWPGGGAFAQVAAPDQLDSLLVRAVSVHPGLRATRERVTSAQARVVPAGQLADPMVGVGVMNLPISEPSLRDEMTMLSLSASQLLPYPGKLPLQRRAMEAELKAAEATADGMRLDVEREVKSAYFELAYLDGALEILERNQRVVVGLIDAGAARYTVGAGGQQEVLRARAQAARMAQDAVMLVEERRATLARLNALLDRPSDAALEGADFPGWIRAAAVNATSGEIRFVSARLGARADDSPVAPLAELQERAVLLNPELRAHEAMTAAQAARAQWAEKQHLPDIEISAQYGFRAGNADMVSVMASVPLPVRRGSRQSAELASARADLRALEAEHHERVNALHAEVAELHAELERARAHGALFVKAILPQGRASLASATAAFQVGRAELPMLLAEQATLYGYETAQLRALTDFALKLAALERVVGAEVLR